MKRSFIITVLFITVISTNFSFLFAQNKTLYVVTRSTKEFRIGSQDFPSVGLFSTQDDGKNWKHYGWNFTKCFSVSVTGAQQELTFYLSCGNGVQKSEDDGTSWIITTGANIYECLKTAIHPENPQVVYAATAYGIFKTDDGGKTWLERNKGLTSTFTPTVFFDANNADILYCATEAGIHRSLNGGKLWEPIGLLGLGIRTLIQHPSNFDKFAAGTENDGVFISKNHGKTWIQKNNGLTHKTVYMLAFDPKNERVLYAGTFRGGILKTVDGGDSWQTFNKNLRNLDIHALLVDPDNSNKVYAGTLNDGLWLSENAGKSWHFIGLETSQVWDMVFY